MSRLKVSLLIFLALLFDTDGKICRLKYNEPYLFMGTKTSYVSARGNDTRLPLDSNCKPVQIWALIRHGTRYPETSESEKFSELEKLRDKIVENHEKGGRGKLCDKDLKSLRKWSLDHDIPQKALTKNGKKELRKLARRLKASYPELLHEEDYTKVSNKDYKFRATTKKRTKDSMKAFMKELFDDNDVDVKPEKPPKNDTLLYTYRNCPAFQKSLDLKPRNNPERQKFMASPLFYAVRQNVSDRLGFDSVIEIDTLLLIYEICRFETSWTKSLELSVWCAALTNEDIKVLEFNEDIEYYYYTGPERHISTIIGCPALQDMITRFRNLDKANADEHTEPKAVFYFSHSVTLHTLMTTMGLTKEPTPLLSTNYENIRNRRFKMSLLGPFAGNIVAVFYRCNDGQTIRNKVAIHLSERIWRVPGCDSSVCDWETFERNYADAADNCNLDFCYQ